MSTKDNGGQAFPHYPAAQYEAGMTLRDWLAGMELGKADGCAVCDHPSMYDRLADHCYRMADAMIRARDK
jgi:hypothetical protein